MTAQGPHRCPKGLDLHYPPHRTTCVTQGVGESRTATPGNLRRPALPGRPPSIRRFGTPGKVGIRTQWPLSRPVHVGVAAGPPAQRCLSPAEGCYRGGVAHQRTVLGQQPSARRDGPAVGCRSAVPVCGGSMCPLVAPVRRSLPALNFPPMKVSQVTFRAPLTLHEARIPPGRRHTGTTHTPSTTDVHMSQRLHTAKGGPALPSTAGRHDRRLSVDRGHLRTPIARLFSPAQRVKSAYPPSSRRSPQAQTPCPQGSRLGATRNITCQHRCCLPEPRAAPGGSRRRRPAPGPCLLAL